MPYIKFGFKLDGIQTFHPTAVSVQCPLCTIHNVSIKMYIFYMNKLKLLYTKCGDNIYNKCYHELILNFTINDSELQITC